MMTTYKMDRRRRLNSLWYISQGPQIESNGRYHFQAEPSYYCYGQIDDNGEIVSGEEWSAHEI